MAAGREISSFQCDVCGETLESWNTAWVPHYQLVAGPATPPEWKGGQARLRPPSVTRRAMPVNRGLASRTSDFLGLLTIRDGDDASILDAAGADGPSDADSST
jgi:hypothetical protein